ncbi:unnamed protein product, partial [Protopolystoma xenopodis]
MCTTISDLFVSMLLQIAEFDAINSREIKFLRILALRRQTVKSVFFSFVITLIFHFLNVSDHALPGFWAGVLYQTAESVYHLVAPDLRQMVAQILDLRFGNVGAVLRAAATGERLSFTYSTGRGKGDKILDVACPHSIRDFQTIRTAGVGVSGSIVEPTHHIKINAASVKVTGKDATNLSGLAWLDRVSLLGTSASADQVHPHLAYSAMDIRRYVHVKK